MIARVEPIPEPTLDAIIAWFRALDGRDLTNALMGAATVGIVGALLCVGLMILMSGIRGRRS